MIKNLEHIAPLESWKKVYFLGIGGIGMSALARYLKAKDIAVSGYDRTPSQLTNELIAEGIPVHFKERPDEIPADLDLAIYTPAVPKDNKEFERLLERLVPLLKRSELLGMVANDKKLIAVAGTHGKTSVSCLLANIMNQAPDQSNAILGGISKNIQSNLILAPETRLFITEADEFDRSFLRLNPWIAVITSTDADHLDVYGDHENLKNTFTEFTSKLRKGGKLLIKSGIDLKTDVDETVARYSYSIYEPADFQAVNIKLRGQRYHFDLITPFGEIEGLHLGIPGIMNLENAVAASAAAILAGVRKRSINSGLSSFKGVKRRFDQRIISDDFIYIDDYAHHPKEIEACIDSVRKLYPGKEITGVFQPHLYSRTRDFADEFAKSLQELDRIILLELYPARELPVEGISSRMLLEKIDHPNKLLSSKEDLVDKLLKIKPQVLLTLGAGDIDRLVEPIENAFKEILK
jgi:UDP-N-acetylmuramate--alanine ligase